MVVEDASAAKAGIRDTAAAGTASRRIISRVATCINTTSKASRQRRKGKELTNGSTRQASLPTLAHIRNIGETERVANDVGLVHGHLGSLA